MASYPITTWMNKFLKKGLPSPENDLSAQDQTDLRALIDAASTTAASNALARANHTGVQPQSSVTDLEADLAAKAPLVSPTFEQIPTTTTAAVGNRSAQIASTEFVWDRGPLKAIPPIGAGWGSLQAQFQGGEDGNTLGSGCVDLQTFRDLGEQVATGEFSFACGSSNTASGAISFACGSSNTASIQGQVVSGAASANSQHSRIDLYGTTAEAATTILAVDGASAKLTIRSGWTMAGTINILGVKTTDGASAAHYMRKFAIKNVGGDTSLIDGGATDIGTDYESDVGLAVAITAGGVADDAMYITVTGLAATDIRWAAVVDAVEVKLT